MSSFDFKYKCQYCNCIVFNDVQETVFHYLIEHKQMDKLQNIKDVEVKKAIGLGGNTISSGVNEVTNKVDKYGWRKCGVCGIETEAEYINYVNHLMFNHNLRAIQEFVDDPYFLNVIAGRKFVNRKCEICQAEISCKIEDYIKHLILTHSNKAEFSKIKDSYTVQILLLPDAKSYISTFSTQNTQSSQPPNTSQIDIPVNIKSDIYSKFKLHLLNCGPSETHISAYKSFGELLRKCLQKKEEDGSLQPEELEILTYWTTYETYFLNEAKNILLSKRNQTNGTRKINNFSKFYDDPTITFIDIPNFKMRSIYEKEDYEPKQAQFKNYNNNNNNDNTTRKLEKKGPSQLTFEKYNNSNVNSTNEEKPTLKSNKQSNYSKEDSEPKQEQFKNCNNNNTFNDNKTGNFEKYNNPQINMLNDILANSSQKGNIVIINNINSNNVNTVNNDFNTVNNIINNYGENNEKLQELENKIKFLEVTKKESEEELKNVVEELSKNVRGGNLKINDITKKMEKLNLNIEEIDKQLKKETESREQITKQLNEQGKKINKLEEETRKKIENLEKQVDFLKTQDDDFYVAKFQAVEKEMQLLKLKYDEYTKHIDFSFPPEWEKQVNYWATVLLKNDDPEFLKVSKLFAVTCNKKILNICRIQNTELWKNYCLSRYQLSQKGNTTELLLFHGTNKLPPETIYESKEEGFDMRFANDGYWGYGIYFHEKASYSHMYAYSSQGTQFMFVASVLVGDYIELPRERGLKIPPLKNSSGNVRYDSIKAKPDGSQNDGIFIVYNNLRAYPTYLIEYSP